MQTKTSLPYKIWAFFIVALLAAPRVWALQEASQTREALGEIAPVAIPFAIPQNSLNIPDSPIGDTDLLEEPFSPAEKELSRTLPVVQTKQKAFRAETTRTLQEAQNEKTPLNPSLSVQAKQNFKKSEKKVAKTLAPFAHSLKESNALGALSHLMDGAKTFPVADIGEGERFAREIEEAPKEINKQGVAASITIFGSARLLPRQKALAEHKKTLALARLNPDDKNVQEALKLARQNLQMSKYYEEAYRFGQIVARESGGKIAVATGGGPGIMEAANRGAYEAGGTSIGHTIRLPHEEASNPYITQGLNFLYDDFAPRKMNLRRGAVALAFFPGGFGTMDELFETLTLIQTGKIPRVPIVLVGKKYWKQILNFENFSKMGVISPRDLSLFKIVDTADEAWAALTAPAPLTPSPERGVDSRP